MDKLDAPWDRIQCMWGGWLTSSSLGTTCHVSNWCQKTLMLHNDVCFLFFVFFFFEEYYRKALKAVKEENDRLVELYTKKSKEQAQEVSLLSFFKIPTAS